MESDLNQEDSEKSKLAKLIDNILSTLTNTKSFFDRDLNNNTTYHLFEYISTHHSPNVNEDIADIIKKDAAKSYSTLKSILAGNNKIDIKDELKIFVSKPELDGTVAKLMKLYSPFYNGLPRPKGIVTHDDQVIARIRGNYEVIEADIKELKTILNGSIPQEDSEPPKEHHEDIITSVVASLKKQDINAALDSLPELTKDVMNLAYNAHLKRNMNKTDMQRKDDFIYFLNKYDPELASQISKYVTMDESIALDQEYNYDITTHGDVKNIKYYFPLVRFLGYAGHFADIIYNLGQCLMSSKGSSITFKELTNKTISFFTFLMKEKEDPLRFARKDMPITLKYNAQNITKSLITLCSKWKTYANMNIFPSVRNQYSKKAENEFELLKHEFVQLQNSI